jgi:hypothetical protein
LTAPVIASVKFNPVTRSRVVARIDTALNAARGNPAR